MHLDPGTGYEGLTLPPALLQACFCSACFKPHNREQPCCFQPTLSALSLQPRLLLYGQPSDQPSNRHLSDFAPYNLLLQRTLEMLLQKAVRKECGKASNISCTFRNPYMEITEKVIHKQNKRNPTAKQNQN